MWVPYVMLVGSDGERGGGSTGGSTKADGVHYCLMNRVRVKCERTAHRIPPGFALDGADGDREVEGAGVDEPTAEEERNCTVHGVNLKYE